MNPFAFLLDIAFLAVVLLTARFVSRRLIVEAAVIFLIVLISALLSRLLFEPLADFVRRSMFLPTDINVTKFFWLAFAIAIFLFSVATLHETLFKVIGNTVRLRIEPEINGTENLSTWLLGLLTGYVLAAFLLTLLHTIPGPRDLWGVFDPEANKRPGPIMALAPDYQFIWLADFVSNRRAGVIGTRRKMTPATIARKMYLGWFPVRYAIWREELSEYYVHRLPVEERGVEEDTEQTEDALSEQERSEQERSKDDQSDVEENDTDQTEANQADDTPEADSQSLDADLAWLHGSL